MLCYRWNEPGDRSHAKPVSNGLNQTGTAQPTRGPISGWGDASEEGSAASLKRSPGCGLTQNVLIATY